MKITKKSGKPFKNGRKMVTVKGFGVNPYTNKLAFILEDGSFVDRYQCKVIEEKTVSNK